MKIKSYLEKSRRQRKRDYIGIKNSIRRSAPVLGGRFYTHDYLHGNNGWSDIYFLSLKPMVFYNATLETTAHAFREKVERIAFERSCECLPYRITIPGFEDAEETGQTEQAPVEPFEGLSRTEWIDREVMRLIDAGETGVTEGVRLDSGYVFGMGLIATLNVPAITVDAVNLFIADFLANEEQPWQGSMFTYDRSILEKTGRVESNLLAEPWEWDRLTEV